MLYKEVNGHSLPYKDETHSWIHVNWKINKAQIFKGGYMYIDLLLVIFMVIFM